MKTFRLSLIVAALLALVPIENAQAIMSRGIFVNGAVHYIGLGVQNKNNVLFHQSFDSVNIPTPINFKLSPSGTTQLSPACNPDSELRSSMNGAVFDNKIFFVYTGYPQAKGKAGSCNYSNGTNLYVTYWDLTSNKWAADLDADKNPIFPMKLGTVHHDNLVNKKGSVTDVAGAAIAVFNPDPNNATNPTSGQLYVFGDNGTYTSADGINWAFHTGPNNGTDGQPLDAITYYPPDANPRLMLILSSPSNGTFTNLWGGTWNGLFGDSSDFDSKHITTGPFSVLNGGVALFAGTATAATDPNFPGGNKGPSLQLFVGGNMGTTFPQNQVTRVEYRYNQTGGTWGNVQYLDPPYGFSYLIAFPWFTVECTDSNNIQRQNFEVNYFDYAKNKLSNLRGLSFISDAMVPQNTDIPLGCGNWGGTVTNTNAGTAEDQATLRKYWTLAGVIMGSPPFALNDVQDYDIPDLSNLTYGQNQTSEVVNTQTSDNSVLVSAGVSVRGGMKDKFGIEGEVDCGYKHGWESEHQTNQSSTIGYGYQFGTVSANTEDLSQLGAFGWAIFHTPNVVVQDYAIYAYDYDVNSKSGTSIGQDLHTIQVDQQNLSATVAAFELANPGGSNDSYPGLMSGITPLAPSTDLMNPVWQQQWESNSSESAVTHYVTKVGTGEKGEAQLNSLSFADAISKANFSNEIQTVKTTGQTSDVDVSLGLNVSIGSELNGFKVGLKAGYDGEFSNSVETSTTLGSDVEAELNMKACYTSDCAKVLQVQPHLLLATDPYAPWIPTAFSGSRPWAMTWTVTSYRTVGGKTLGQSPTPAKLAGTVEGNTLSISSLSSPSNGHYRVSGGRLQWLKSNGKVSSIPMSASTFDPNQGVTVRLNSYEWSSATAQGKWTRKGNIWNYRTDSSVQRDRVSVKLDFGRRTWGVSISKADLSSAMGATDGRAHVALNVNGKYEFFFDVKHQIASSWSQRPDTQDANATSLTRYSGSYPYSGNGEVRLEGKLPANLDHFGDVSFVVNGHQFNVPVISEAKYRHAIANGESLVIKKGTSILTLDFGKKNWKFKTTGRLARLLAPVATKAGIQFKVGGQRWYSGEHTILNYTSRIKYNGRR